MRLYKIELYKICHRKFFAAGVICIMGILLFYFQTQVMAEETSVNRVLYRGYAAVRIDREITEEFKGSITGEKAEQIIGKYGFPYKADEDGVVRNANFLNLFVSEYFWNDDLDIKETDIGSVMEITGGSVSLEYYRGWRVFLYVMQVGMILGSILTLCSIATVFANERQTKILPLLFTAKEGKRKDIYAKFAAAVTVAGAMWLGIVIFDLALCGFVYGLDGLECYNGMVMNHMFAWPERTVPMDEYVALALLFSLLGILTLCAITLCLSAKCRSNFYAVVTAAVSWSAPILAVGLLAGGFYGIFKYMAAAPVFMVLYLTIDKIYDIWQIITGIAVIVSVFCTISAYREYCRSETI